MSQAKKVLIVDDSPTMCNMLKATMQEMGFDATISRDGVEALAVAGKQPLDLVLTDINMPNMDGIELIRALRQSSNNKFTPILVISTESGDNIKQAGKDAGATGWIVKPFNPETLGRAVKKVCNLG